MGGDKNGQSSPWRELLCHAKPQSSPRKKVFMNFMLVRKPMMIFAPFASLRETEDEKPFVKNKDLPPIHARALFLKDRGNL
jgi:hypothetical protein